MALVEFKNKPDTTTPINATNLNNNFNEINGELYYKSGDNYHIDAQYYAGGVLTGSAKTIQFSIILPKRLDNISSVNINQIYLTARGINGYLLNSYTLSDLNTNGNLSIVAIENNCISIQYTSNNAFEITNNTPVGIYLRDTILQFD